MTVSPVFGPIISASSVEQAVIDTLKLWFPTYIAELERQTGREPGSVPQPRSYTTVNEFDPTRKDQTPAVIVVSPGTDKEPLRQGDGSYQMSWAVGVAVLATANSRENSNLLAKLYGAAVRAIVLQQQSLGGIASEVDWGAESYDDVPADFLDVGAAARTAFSVTVPGVVTDLLGPAVPDLNPTPYPTVATVQIDAERRSLDS